MSIFSFILKIVAWPMRVIFSFIVKVFIVAAFSGIILMLTGNFWIPKLFEIATKAKTGFNAYVGESDGSLFTANIDFKDVTIENPRSCFHGKNFIDFNEISLDLSVRSLFTNTFVVENIVIDIDDISLIKNKDGVLNLTMFGQKIVENPKKYNESAEKPAKQKKTKKSSTAKNDTSKTSANKKDFLVENLVFRLNTIHVIDENEESLSKKTFTVNYNKTFSNVKSLSEIESVLIQDLSKYGIALLIQSTFETLFKMPVLSHGISGASKATDISKTLIKGTLHGTTEGVKKSLNGVKNLFSKEKKDTTTKEKSSQNK